MFQGVGDGTVVENVQIHANADDGVEFFGGTINVRNLVATYTEVDRVDCTQGFRIDKEEFGSFFQNYDHTGAFSGAEAAWTHGWTLQDF